MIEKPVVKHVNQQSAAVIRITVPRDQIRDVMGPGYQEAMAAVTDQGVGPAGPWYTHHFRIDPEVFDFEIGVPVSGPVTPAGRVEAGERPAMKAAAAVYQGPYEGLAEAWGAFEAWLEEEGLITGPGFWEVYAVGPEAGVEPADYRTELIRPVFG